MKVTKRNKVDTLMAGLRHINLECSLCGNKLTEGYFRSYGAPVCVDCASTKPIRIDVDNDY